MAIDRVASFEALIGTVVESFKLTLDAQVNDEGDARREALQIIINGLAASIDYVSVVKHNTETHLSATRAWIGGSILRDRRVEWSAYLVDATADITVNLGQYATLLALALGKGDFKGGVVRTTAIAG